MTLSKIDKDNIIFVMKELEQKVQIFVETKQYYMKEQALNTLTKYLCAVCDRYPNDSDLDPFLIQYEALMKKYDK